MPRTRARGAREGPPGARAARCAGVPGAAPSPGGPDRGAIARGADGSSAAVILASSHLGFALSTTQVASGSILGSGVGHPGAHVRWSVAGRMVLAWLMTLPAAGLVGALMWFLADGIGGLAGALVVLALLIAGAVAMYVRSRHHQVTQHNVDEIWEGGPKVRKPSKIA